MSPSQTTWPFIINVGNSIIGVTVLAMPFCFKTCGVILGSLMLFFSTWLTVVSCQLLMKAGVTARRRSFSLLAYYTHGVTGKLIVEMGMIGLQIGTLVAQVVIIGDLGPGIVSKFTGLENTHRLRTALIVFLCTCVGLPLGLLKDVRTLSKTSTLCIMFYAFFTCYVVLLSIPNLISGSWYYKVNFWRKEGFFQCLPIFSFAFGCQTQLFIVYDALADPSLKRINNIVSSAVNMCCACYLLVGFFGYIAYCNIEDMSGDIINHFTENNMVDIIKLCFVVSIAVSIPLICFPCRASLYTMLFRQKPKEELPGSGKIPEFHFKVITFCIIIGAMIIGILIPNIEFVLGLNGATMGTLICYVFPAIFFLNVMSDSSERKFTGRLVLLFGLTIMIASTYTILSTPTIDTNKIVKAEPLAGDNPIIPEPPLKKDFIDEIKKDEPAPDGKEDKPPDDHKLAPDKDTERHEPPIPQSPDDNHKLEVTKGPVDEEGRLKSGEEVDKNKKDVELNSDKDKNKDEKLSNQNVKQVEKEEKPVEVAEKGDSVNKDEGNVEGKVGDDDTKKEADKDDTKKDGEDKQLEVEKKQEEILAKLEHQQEAQEKLLQEQKEILEQLKEHQEKHKDEDGNGAAVQDNAQGHIGEPVKAAVPLEDKQLPLPDMPGQINNLNNLQQQQNLLDQNVNLLNQGQNVGVDQQFVQNPVNPLVGNNIAGNQLGNQLGGNALAGNQLGGNALAGNQLGGNVLAGNQLGGNALAGKQLGGNVLAAAQQDALGVKQQALDQQQNLMDILNQNIKKGIAQNEAQEEKIDEIKHRGKRDAITDNGNILVADNGVQESNGVLEYNQNLNVQKDVKDNVQRDLKRADTDATVSKIVSFMNNKNIIEMAKETDDYVDDVAKGLNDKINEEIGIMGKGVFQMEEMVNTDKRR